ncbi:MAG TPA: hypothetical protein VHB27_02740 [Rhodopila sp.]|uniref:hypothetical protein n=1 Tax=Rhodopila sp. TaxID=2480087 RepID=UPI002D032E52|nr:hypothetical protein [Rhodopila sp.]HVY14119.1 hypothetical protein [Rhodopila sp.]
MIGITLSPEQIHQAPPEVRRWLEEQLASTFGLSRAAPSFDGQTRRLVACSPEEAQAVLSVIGGVLPAIGVFLELGRGPAVMAGPGLRALSLGDMLRHTHLQSLDQLNACLEAINEAVKTVRREPDAALTALDGSGHCIVAEATARSIIQLWQQIVAAHNMGDPGVAPEAMTPAAAVRQTQPPMMPPPAFDGGEPPHGAVA